MYSAVFSAFQFTNHFNINYLLPQICNTGKDRITLHFQVTLLFASTWKIRCVRWEQDLGPEQIQLLVPEKLV